MNTTDSRVELIFDVARSTALTSTQRDRALTRLASQLRNGALVIVASEERSQLRNREAAARRLREVLAEAISPPPPRRRPTKLSRAARQRRLDAKRRNSEVKRLRRPPDE